MPDLTLQLNLSAAQVLKLYAGQAQVVKARATTGETVQFPASALRRHVMPDGVRGTYRLSFDAHHKFVGLERVDSP
jgi:hypothetical protein